MLSKYLILMMLTQSILSGDCKRIEEHYDKPQVRNYLKNYVDRYMKSVDDLNEVLIKRDGVVGDFSVKHKDLDFSKIGLTKYDKIFVALNFEASTNISLKSYSWHDVSFIVFGSSRRGYVVDISGTKNFDKRLVNTKENIDGIAFYCDISDD